MIIGNVEIRKLNHASVLLKGSKVIYIDPYKINEKEKADIVLITHQHYDHCSPMDIQKIITPSTIIVTVADNQSKLSGLKFKHLKLVRPGEKFVIDGVKIETVAAYNTNKPFHPKENEWVGFIVEMDGQRIYHAGDTDLIPEMKNVKCDVALLPGRNLCY
jgi:L-ascorbate metabolism protein UlaG (beta-lactamase superfamily)